MTTNPYGMYAISKAQLLTPEAAGLANLADALQAGDGIRTGTGSAPVQRLADAQGMVFVQSSGSTAAPKTIQRSYASWQSSAAVNRELFQYSPNDRFCALGPLAHSLPLYAAFEALASGASFALLAHERPKRQALRIAALRISVLYTTPTQLRAILQHSEHSPFPNLRLVLVGGGKLQQGLREQLHTLSPHTQLYEFYGASETSFITLSDTTTPPHSVGRPYPGVSLRFAKDRIWVKSPYLFNGYAIGSEAHTIWRDGWLSIGETGYLENGYLILTGRAGRRVTLSDHTFSLDMVETILAPITSPKAVIAFVQPDHSRTNRLALAVEGPEDKDLTARLRRCCHEEIGPFAVPHQISFLPEFPTLSAGKPDRNAIVAAVSEPL